MRGRRRDAATAAARSSTSTSPATGSEFDLPLDWRLVRGFTRAALEAVSDIPYGETAGYGEVAISAGSPRAARAVGTACATTPFSIVVPVHRVVRADGSLGEYGGHPEVKRFLLDLERAATWTGSADARGRVGRPPAARPGTRASARAAHWFSQSRSVRRRLLRAEAR